MICKCRTCSNSSLGGTLILLDDSWFTLDSENYILALDQVANFINLTELIKHFQLFLIDYGYFEIINSCAPYTEPAYTGQRPIIIQNIISHPYKKVIPTYSKYQNISLSYEKCLEYLEAKFVGREIIVATCNKDTGFVLHNNKMIYYWNPFIANNKIIKRYFVQSSKHKVKRPNEEETYCPIPEDELNCALQRAVSLMEYNSFHDERFELCSYHEKYSLIIKNKYTTDCIIQVPNNFRFSYQNLPVNLQNIEYHGYHFDSSKDEGQRICSVLQRSSIPIDPSILKSKDEFLKRERQMLRDLA